MNARNETLLTEEPSHTSTTGGPTGLKKKSCLIQSQQLCNRSRSEGL